MDMGFKSKQQLRWMAYAEDHGKIKKGTFSKWLSETKSVSKLPLYAKKRRKK